MRLLKRSEVSGFMHRLEEERPGRFFSVVFTKRTTGEDRRMVCRRGVTSRLTGGGRKYEFESKGLLSVFDTEKDAYRCIPLDAVKSVTTGGDTYVVVKG